MGPVRSGSPKITPAARLGASAGCSRATDRSEERQHVNRKCGSGSSSAARHRRPSASIAVRVRQPESIGSHIFTVGVVEQGAVMAVHELVANSFMRVDGDGWNAALEATDQT